MVNTKQIVLGVLAVAALSAFVIWLMPDEKKAIRRQFARLSELARKDGNESLFVTASQAKAIAKLMTDPCELKGNLHSLGGTYSRQEAAMAVAGIRTQFDTMALDLVDLTIELPGERQGPGLSHGQTQRYRLRRACQRSQGTRLHALESATASGSSTHARPSRFFRNRSKGGLNSLSPQSPRLWGVKPPLT